MSCFPLLLDGDSYLTADRFDVYDGWVASIESKSSDGNAVDEYDTVAGHH